MIDNKTWIAHVAKDFFPIWKNRLSLDEKIEISPLAPNFYKVQFKSPPQEQHLSDSIFSRYWFPVDFMWPTKVHEKGFVEKCAQGLSKKFSQTQFHNVIVFSFHRQHQSLASNLRGRLLQTLNENLSRFSSEKPSKNSRRKPLNICPGKRTVP